MRLPRVDEIKLTTENRDHFAFRGGEIEIILHLEAAMDSIWDLNAES